MYDSVSWRYSQLELSGMPSSSSYKWLHVSKWSLQQSSKRIQLESQKQSLRSGNLLLLVWSSQAWPWANKTGLQPKHSKSTPSQHCTSFNGDLLKVIKASVMTGHNDVRIFRFNFFLSEQREFPCRSDISELKDLSCSFEIMSKKILRSSYAWFSTFVLVLLSYAGP